MKLVLLAQAQPLGQIGGLPEAGFGPWGNLGRIGTPIQTAAGFFTNIISRTIGVMTTVVGIWFIFNLIIGAFSFLAAGGSEEGIKKATTKITQSLIGLVVVVAAYAIVSLLGALLGFEILQPQELIELLGPK